MKNLFSAFATPPVDRSKNRAVFESSPLVKRNHSVMAGFAFAWVFAESERRVEANE